MTDENEPIVFDRAELPPEPDAAPMCSACKRPLGRDHFTINQAQICEDCRHVLSKELSDAKSGRAFLRALGLGAVAAIGGSVAWYAVAKITGMEIGLLAIAVGYIVGRAVRKGSRSPGGRRYQALAMLLTYLSITGSYIPLVMKTLAESPSTAAGAPSAQHVLPPAPGASAPSNESPAPAASITTPGATTEHTREAPGALAILVTLVFVVGIALVAPFLGGASNILGLILIAIALYEAWKLNKAAPLVLEGPFRTRKARRDVPAPTED